MKLDFYRIFGILLFSFVFSEKLFLIDSQSDSHINIKFNLTDYKIEKINGLDQIVLNKSNEEAIDNNQKISTFIR